MSTKIYTVDDFEIEGDTFYMCNALADFEITYDDTAMTVDACTLYRVRLGGVNLTREQAVDMTTKATVAQIEDHYASKLQEQMTAGKPEIGAASWGV